LEDPNRINRRTMKLNDEETKIGIKVGIGIVVTTYALSFLLPYIIG